MGPFQKPEKLKRLFPWSDDLNRMDSGQKIKDKLSHLINNRWLFLKHKVRMITYLLKKNDRNIYTIVHQFFIFEF